MTRAQIRDTGAMRRSRGRRCQCGEGMAFELLAGCDPMVPAVVDPFVFPAAIAFGARGFLCFFVFSPAICPEDIWPPVWGCAIELCEEFMGEDIAAVCAWAPALRQHNAAIEQTVRRPFML